MDEKKCLKCGRPCAEDQAFCAECLAEMEKYPVKPGVVVLLPPKEQSRPAVRRRFTAPSPEEQLAKLKKKLAVLRLSLILALAAAGVLGWLTVQEFFREDDVKPLPGQNYSAENSSEPSETE